MPRSNLPDLWRAYSPENTTVAYRSYGCERLTARHFGAAPICRGQSNDGIPLFLPQLPLEVIPVKGLAGRPRNWPPANRLRRRRPLEVTARHKIEQCPRSTHAKWQSNDCCRARSFRCSSNGNGTMPKPLDRSARHFGACTKYRSTDADFTTNIMGLRGSLDGHYVPSNL